MSESRDDDAPPLPDSHARTHNLLLLELPAACRDRVSIAETITALTGGVGAALWTIEVLGWELSGSDLSSFGGCNGLGDMLTRLVLWDVDLAGDTLRGLAAQLSGLQSFTFASRFRSNPAADDNDEDLVPDTRWRLPEDVVGALPRLNSLDLSVHPSECAFGRLAESLAGLEALAHLRLRGPISSRI
ncbi:hypothetical protein HK405_006021 [Cladochytrium tenue]|nr:hypothetical protein HK405_006021 [Cladochytrium tenue]